MRESRTFAERTTVLKTDEVKKRYFLIFEGASTEKIYFEALENMRDDIGIDPLIELVPIIRSYSEGGWSNPKKILDRVIENLEEEETGQLTYESLLNRIMDYLYDERILTTSKVQAHALWGILKKGCDKILKKCLNENVDNVVSDCNILVGYLNQESDIVNIVDDISGIIQTCNITYDSRLDEICLIVDRGKLLENPQVTAKRRYTEHELRRLLPGYHKGKYDVDKLIRNIPLALRNAEKFCQNEVLLISEVGTNIGRLILLLKGEDCKVQTSHKF